MAFTDEDRVSIANDEYNDYTFGSEVKTDSGARVGYVAEVHYDQSTGENSYIIVDADPTANGYKPSDVKHVTVLYQGSSTDFKGDTGNAWNDWVQNDAPLAVGSIIGGNPTPQMKSGAATLQRTLSE
ncbi:hypothetical protein OZX62_09675 [Bifidobacterium sp. ESL0690]|uniref:PRC-barrel domain-containing protein n=1 Tax=Bifidobacterium sp. ESL0690 TaxID=2983214 RepID=UPI0023F8F075|nr:hypothetical protein [Bifidobacterium sp. ESL0690]WEV46680.1 hypothetical protein OZX62_09675 [Bifidobacterium sp. ESL0690]